MKMTAVILTLILISSLGLSVSVASPVTDSFQNPPAPPAPPPPPPPPLKVELGKWWKNSATVREIGLKDAQIEQIEKVFLSHRVKLESLNDEVRHAEEQFKPIMNADKPDQSKVAAQLDKVLAARNNLERENTMMMLAIRDVLTLDQWKKLQEIRRAIPPPPPPPAPPAPPAPPRPPGSFAEDKVYTVGEWGVSPPRVEYQPIPSYTQEAREDKIEGIIILQCIIRRDGSVGELKVRRGLGHGLDEVAMDTVRSQWRFKPGMLNGVPVNVQANIEISYRLPH